MKTEIYDLAIQHKPGSNGTELTFDGDVVAVMDSEVNADAILDQIRLFLSNLEWNKQVAVSIKNDEDKLGIIVDYYIGDDCEDSLTLWFCDYTIEE